MGLVESVCICIFPVRASEQAGDEDVGVPASAVYFFAGVSESYEEEFVVFVSRGADDHSYIWSIVGICN